MLSPDLPSHPHSKLDDLTDPLEYENTQAKQTDVVSFNTTTDEETSCPSSAQNCESVLSEFLDTKTDITSDSLSRPHSSRPLDEKQRASGSSLLRPEEVNKKQIKFKDAIGRMFCFPINLVKTWEASSIFEPPPPELRAANIN